MSTHVLDHDALDGEWTRRASTRLLRRPAAAVPDDGADAMARIRARRVADVALARRVTLAATLALVVLGLVAIDSATMVQAHGAAGLLSTALGRQLVWCAVGLVALFVASEVDYHRWARLATPLYVVNLVLLALVLVPGIGSGLASYGARRWIRLGPVGFQPSELAKLTLVLYLAAYLSFKGDRLAKFFTGTVPAMLATGVLCALVLVEPDFGTAAFLGGIAFLLLFIGGMRLAHLVPIVLLSLPLVVHVVSTRMTHVQRRIAQFLDPTADLQGRGHQIHQSLVALGSGGLVGRGIGEGRQKLYFLPEGRNDFILSNLGEEMGFVGCALVIALFALFVWYGAKIALTAPDDLGCYVSIGIVLSIGLQAAANVAVVTASVPTKGISLPFVSYGGSSLVIFLFMVGVLLNVARAAMDVEATGEREVLR